MRSLLRSVKKRKKSRRLGKVEVVRRAEYGELDVDTKVEMIRSLVPLGLMHVGELLDDEVRFRPVLQREDHVIAAVDVQFDVRGGGIELDLPQAGDDGP